MKNFIVYELPENYSSVFKDESVFEDLLFVPCSTYTKKTMGFVKNPFDTYVEYLSGGVRLLTIRSQKKSPKKSHVDHIVKIRSVKHHILHGVKPNKHESGVFKDEAIEEVMAKTFPDAPVDTNILLVNNLVFIEVSGYNSALDFFKLVEQSLQDNLPYAQPQIKDVSLKFNSFIVNGIEDPFVLGSSSSLIDKEGRKVAISKGTLEGSVADDLVKDNAMVGSLELEFDSIITFKVNPNLEFSGVKYSKDMLGEVEDLQGSVLLQVKEVIRMYERFKEILK